VLEIKEKLTKKKRLNREERELREVLEQNPGRKVSTISGVLAYGNRVFVQRELSRVRPDVSLMVYPIKNDFFGPRITVTGLLTGQDIVKQLQGKDLGDALLIPKDCLKADEEIFLDDMRLTELESALQVKTIIVKSYGMDYLRAITGCQCL